MPRETSLLLQRVRRTVKRHQMLVPGDRVLVAVSGGPDSVALLGALATLAPQLGVFLTAAHLNHGLRGEESGRDQRCAEEVAARLEVACVLGRSDDLRAGPNLEQRARQARYEFLRQAAAAQHCTKIATGHTADDQAETVLLRLLRGTGSDGLGAIRPVRDGHIIRPLLECSRREVVDFLTARRLPFCEDSSNADRRFLRNRVRHELIPLLQSLNPAVHRHLGEFARVITAELEWLHDDDRRQLASAVAPDGSLEVAAVAGAERPLALRLVRAWLRQRRGDLVGICAAHVEAVVELACGGRPNGRVRLPGREWVAREYVLLRHLARDPSDAVETEHLLVPGKVVDLRSGWRIRAGLEPVGAGWQPPADLLQVIADAEVLAGPLLVRSPRPGDRIQPFGMRGHRKLQDVLVDRKIPARERLLCPVIECAGKVFWVPGIVRGNQAPLTPKSRLLLRLIAEHPAVAGT